MLLSLRGVIRREKKHCPITDNRRRLNYVLAEYVGDDGHEYRKSFSSYSEPIVPPSGNHEYLNSFAIQY
jgi:hypothetical protein